MYEQDILQVFILHVVTVKYEGPRTVQYGWNFNPVAISFLENVPNIFLR